MRDLEVVEAEQDDCVRHAWHIEHVAREARGAARPAHIVKPAVAADARAHHRDRRARLPGEAWGEVGGVAPSRAPGPARPPRDRVARRPAPGWAQGAPPPALPQAD